MVVVVLKKHVNMKKLDVDDAVIYLFAHQDKHNPIQFPDTLVYIVDMYTKYRTDNFLLERHNYRYAPNGSFYVRTKANVTDEILTYSEMYINFLKEIQSIKNIDDKLGQIKNVLDYERPCNQEDGFTLFKNKMIPILLFGFYKE